MLTLTISGRVKYQLIKQTQWVKSQPAMQEITGDPGSIPGLGRSPAGGHSNPLQYSCLENPMDRGDWWATVHMVAKSWTLLKQLSTYAHFKLIS